MTFSHYSAEEIFSRSKLAIMMTLPSGTSPKNNEIIQVTRCMDFEEANGQVNSLCGALPRDDLRMHKCIKSDISVDLEKRSIY